MDNRCYRNELSCLSCVRDRNVYGGVLLLCSECVLLSLSVRGRSLCLEGFSLFKQANELLFADQDIY